MIKTIWNYLNSFVIGIKYQPNFGFAERTGELFDEILYKKGSYFNKDFFKHVESNIGGGKKLYNKHNKNYLQINNENIVFNFESNDIDEVNDVAQKYKVQLIEDKFYKFDLTRIHRIGFIYRYEIDDEELAKNLVSKCSSFQTKDVKDLQLRFSKKIMTESLPKKNENDYQNVIYSIIKDSKSNKVALMIDFQHYYEPLISDTKIIDFERFKNKVDKYNEVEVKEWLNKNYHSL